MAKNESALYDVSDVGLKDLAEAHVKSAVNRLGKLVENEDPKIAFEASQLILRLARPHSRGVWGVPFPSTPWGDIWGEFEGGGRAG